jgi:WD40 repeat protein
VVAVVFSPDGRRLASASAEIDKRGEVRVWDAATGEALCGFQGQAISNPVVRLAFSPDGRRLAAGAAGNTVRVWDLDTRQAVHTLSAHSEPILNLAFTPDGRRLISAGRDRVVNVWDLKDAARAAPVPHWTMPQFSLSPWSMALSRDGNRLAIGGPTADGNVRLYDMRNGTLLHTLMDDLRIISVAFSPDGRLVAAAGHDCIVRLWEVSSGREVLQLRGHTDLIGHVAFSPDGERLVSASADGTVRVWDASPFDETADLSTRTLGPRAGEYFGIAFSPDSRLLAAASADGSIHLWDSETGRQVGAFHGHEDAVLSVAFSPNGQRLVSGSLDRTAKLWDTRTHLALLSRDDFKVMVRGVAFSPDGRAFATGAGQRVQLWDLTGKALLPPLQADPEFVDEVAFSPDGRSFATVGHTASALVWDVATGAQVSCFRGHQSSVLCIAFHPSGQYLVSGGSARNVKLWDRASGQEIHTLSAHSDFVSDAEFSADGRYLATSSWKEVILWDVTSLETEVKEVKRFDRLAGRISSVALSPDGKRLAAASGYKGQGEIKIWDAALWETKH